MINTSGFHKYHSQGILRDFFKDRDTYNFKYGLEYGLNSKNDHSKFNLDEDPTIFGFDLVILNESALFNEISSFLEFGESNGVLEIMNRKETYDEFIKQFSKFFNVDDMNNDIFKNNNNFSSFKNHYLYGVNGLDKLIHYTGMGYETGKKQMVDFGKDKLTFKLNEDVPINAGYLSSLYRTLVYSKLNGRMVIPENLLRFDVAIIISEIRKFNRVSNAIQSNSNDAIQIVNDNISRHIFTLYDCQFDFNSYSFDNDIDETGYGSSSISNGLTFDLYYKFVGEEIEKFNFNINLENEEVKYLNNIRINPNSYQINSDNNSDLNNSTDAKNVDKYPNRSIDRKFHMNTIDNSIDYRSYQFDFPMMNSNFVKSNIELRNKNMNMDEDPVSFGDHIKKGLDNIIDKANQDLQQKVIEERSKLISGLTNKIREISGLRNIKAPTNVYESSNIGQFLLNGVKDFTNLAVGTALSKGSGYLNKLSKGAENVIFDKMDDVTNKLKGVDKNTQYDTKDILGDSDIPNVYNK